MRNTAKLPPVRVERGLELRGYAQRETLRGERVAGLNALARLLDSAIMVPGTNLRLGLDAVLGVIPGIGDFLTGAFSLYFVHEAHRFGASKHLRPHAWQCRSRWFG